MSIFKNKNNHYRILCDECEDLHPMHFKTPEEAEIKVLGEGWHLHYKLRGMHLCKQCYKRKQNYD